MWTRSKGLLHSGKLSTASPLVMEGSSKIGSPSSYSHSQLSSSPRRSLLAQLLETGYQGCETALSAAYHPRSFDDPSLSIPQLFPQLSDAAAYLDIRRSDHFQQYTFSEVQRPSSASHVRNATEAVSSILTLLNELTRGQSPSSPPRAVLHRALLEQGFLHAYFLPGVHSSTLRSQLEELWSPLYADAFSFRTLSPSSQLALCSNLGSFLNASAYSVLLALEHLLRQGEASFALECVVLWWYANPDLFFPVGTFRSLRLLPFTSCMCEGDEKPGIFLKEWLTRLMMRSQLKDISVRGGFLCPDALFASSYRRALRSHRLQETSAAHSITSSLLFRWLEVALQSFWAHPIKSSHTSLRGMEMVGYLLYDWMMDILPDRSECVSEAACFVEDSGDWLFSVASIAASAFLMQQRNVCRQAWARAPDSVSSNPLSDSFTDELRGRFLDGLYTSLFSLAGPVKAIKNQTLYGNDCGKADVDNFLRTCDLAFTAVLTGFTRGGVFQRIHAASSAGICEAWFNALVSCAPKTFVSESPLTTLWLLFLLDSMAASRPCRGSLSQQFIGQEAALVLWREVATNDDAPLTVEVAENHELPVTPVKDTVIADDGTGCPSILRTSSASSLIPGTICALRGLPMDGNDPRDILRLTERAALRVFHHFISLSSFKAAQSTQSFSSYSLLRLLHLLSYIGYVGDPYTPPTKGDLFLDFFNVEVIPFTHPGLKSYLRRIEVLYLSHSGYYGALHLLSTKRHLLAQYSVNPMWKTLTTTLLWSGLPFTKASEELLWQGTFLPSSSNVSLSAAAPLASRPRFGRGSLSWEALEAGLMRSTDLSHLQRFSMLKEVLNHLLLLAVAQQGEAPHISTLSSLYNAVKEHHLRCPSFSFSKKSEECFTEATVLDDEKGEEMKDFSWEASKEEEEWFGVESTHSPDEGGNSNHLTVLFDPLDSLQEESTSARSTRSVPLKKPDKIPPCPAHLPRVEEGSGDATHTANVPSEASCLCAAMVGGVPWSSSHLYLSLLDVISWWTGHAGGEDETHRVLLQQWTDAVAHGYEMNAASKTISDPLCSPMVVAGVLQVILATCPDILLLTSGLLLLRFHSIRRWRSLGFTKTSHGALLPWYVECAMCRLLYHAGLTENHVMPWLHGDKDTKDASTADRSDFDISSFNKLLGERLKSIMEEVCDHSKAEQNLDRPPFQCSFALLPISEMLKLCASITYESLHARFSSLSDVNAKRLPFYVAQFSPSLSQGKPGLPILFPSYQVFGRHLSRQRMDVRPLPKIRGSGIAMQLRKAVKGSKNKSHSDAHLRAPVKPYPLTDSFRSLLHISRASAKSG